MVRNGDRIKVVRGIKVPKGTTGVAFWIGETKYGTRIGFKNDADGAVLWTAMSNVEHVNPAAMPAPADSASAAYAALAARISELEAKVEALEAAADAAAFANAPAAVAAMAPFIPDNADPLDIKAFTN